MNVCIVTVYNSINSGSFWQAYILGEFLKKNGFQVCYLERKANNGSSNSLGYMTKRVIRTAVKKGLGGGARTIKQFCEFKKSQKKFKIHGLNDYSDIDCFILGSDTIWNIQARYFRVNRKRLWGGEFEGKHVISYAASVGNTTKEELDIFPELAMYIKQISAVSVRDLHTAEVVSTMTDKKVEMVCDPTLLWKKESYAKFAGNKPYPAYIYLYLFEPLSASQFAELKCFAERRKLVLVDGTSCSTGCDVNAVNTPDNFVNYMYNADYIVTDTYHGTLFSANFRKNFVVIERRKIKVDEFLESIGLSDRLSNERITNVLDFEPNYDAVEQNFKTLREFSSDFLNKNVTGGGVLDM